MKTTREKVLTTIKLHPKSTIVEIADQVGLTAISVRHHMTTMQAEGLIIAEEERHGVGRPRLVYSLSEKGLEEFPSRYFRLVNSLMDQIKETMPAQNVNSIFSNMADKLTSDYDAVLQNMSLEKRLDLLKTILANEGFEVEWQKEGEQYSIQEISCPYSQIGENHPEVCLFDKSIISNVLDIPMQKIVHHKKEKNLCTYTFDITK